MVEILYSCSPRADLGGRSPKGDSLVTRARRGRRMYLVRKGVPYVKPKTCSVLRSYMRSSPKLIM